MAAGAAGDMGGGGSLVVAMQKYGNLIFFIVENLENTIKLI